MTVLRNILGVIVGMIVGMIANMALVMANLALYPPPEGMDPMDPEQLNPYLATLPTAAFILPLIAHLAQAFVGGWVAAKIGKSRPVLLAMIIGVLSLLGGIMNFMNLSEAPRWMMIEFPLYLVVAWYAGRLVDKSRAGNAAS